jgi:hypothetical protein
MRRARLVLTALVLGIVPLTLRGAAPPVRCDPAQIRALVRQLDHDDYRMREQAEQKLSGLGESDVAVLRKELAAATSAEVRRRLSRVIHRLAVTDRRIQRQKELLRLLLSFTEGRKSSLRQVVDLSPEEFQLLRQAVPDIADPRQRQLAKVILDYIEGLRRPKK